MESLDLFGTNNLSSLGGGLGQSLLDSATLSTPLDDNCGLLGLSQAFRTPIGTNPITSGLDRLSTSDTVAGSNSANLAQDVAANSSSRAADAFDPFSLFKQPLSLAGLPTLPLGSNSTKINNNTGRDPLTGMPNNTPIVSITGSDPLTGGFVSSPLVTAPLPALSSDSVTSPPDISTPTIQSQGNVTNTSGQNGSTSLVVSSDSVNNSVSTNAATTFKANSLLANTPSNSPSQTNLPSPGATLEGEFGNFGGQTNAQLTLKDASGNPETFALKGDGYGEVFKDSKSEQVVFTGIDQTTSVQISADNNIKFGDYTGSTLKVQTTGSITAGDITLKNTAFSSRPGLILQSRLSDGQNSASGSSYSITDLSALLGSTVSTAYDINNSGQVVGEFYSGSDGWYHAFRYSNGLMTDLGTLPGYSESYAYGINNSGLVIGQSDQGDSDGWHHHGFLYSNGLMTDLGTLLGKTNCTPYDINNSGQVVGECFSSNSWWWNAFLYSEGKMTDLGTLLGSGNSAAYGINDRSQVVGEFYNGSNGEDHAFLYSDGKMTDLGTLAGYGSSYATKINDRSQVVGGSGDSGGQYHAFLYSDGKMTDLGTLPGDSDSYASGINDRSQVVGDSRSSNGWHAFLYSNGKMTDLNSLIPSGSGWTLTDARAINDKGQIVGDGTIGGQQHAFLLDPASTATPQDGITAGNISTQGDSIQLQGQKIDLTGSHVSTKGGNITLDGPTILNSTTGATAFNSTAKSKSGDITLTNTLDGNSAGTSSLSLTADQGNISFNNAVGSNAALKDLTVKSAQTVTAKGDITTDGDTTLSATSDITTDKLTSNSGAVKLTSLQGAVTAQALSSGSGTTITATQDIITGNITTSGNAIELTSKHGSINTTAGTLNSSGDNGGAITLSASGNISTGNLTANTSVGSQEDGGEITLTSAQGDIETTKGTLNSTSSSGTGGKITLSAFKNVTTADVFSYGYSSDSIGGDISLTSKNGTINTTAGTLNSSGYTGGDISLSAAGKISTGSLDSYAFAVEMDVTGNGGNITLRSTTGNIDTTTGTLGSEGKSGGAITLTAPGNITAGNITSDSVAGDAGKIELESSNGAIDTTAGTLSAYGGMSSDGSSGDGTDITLKAANSITTANLSTNGSGQVSISLKSDKTGNRPSGDVTTGSISAKEVDILSDGGVTANSDIETNGGDVNITAIRDIVTHNITAQNGAVSLISGAGAITATGEINSDNGLTALAKQNITTNKIQSENNVVLLYSSQGAITINGAIASSGDVSLAALKDVVAQDITSQDGAVALISGNGTVTASGAIASVEDVSVGATGNVVVQNIMSSYGTVALVSTSGAVTVNGEINGGGDVAIAANQNINIRRIGSQGGTIVLDSKQGTVTTNGDVTNNSGDVYISSVGDVVSQNIVSNGGAITIVSSQASVTTGYLRSDGNSSGGKIYLQAAGLIRVTGSFFINNKDYSIYTGVKKKGLVEIVYEDSVVKQSKTKFAIKDASLIGDASISGTVAGIYGPYAFQGKPPQNLGDVLTNFVIFTIEGIKALLENQPSIDPTHAIDINPVTGKVYRNQQERNLVEQLDPRQRQSLAVILSSKTQPEDERLTEDDITKGYIGQEGCFYLELGRHLGGDIEHNIYAYQVTGSVGDFLVLTVYGLYAFYDGLVTRPGDAVRLRLEYEGSVAEVKTGYGWLRKYIAPDNPRRDPRLSYDPSPPNGDQPEIYEKLIKQINRYTKVAEDCGLNFFMSFRDLPGALAARELFQYRNPKRDTERTVKVHHIPNNPYTPGSIIF